MVSDAWNALCFGCKVHIIWGIFFVFKWLPLLWSLLSLIAISLKWWVLLLFLLKWFHCFSSMTPLADVSGFRLPSTTPCNGEWEYKDRAKHLHAHARLWAPVLPCASATDNNVDVADCAAPARRFTPSRNQGRLGVRLPSRLPRFPRHYQVQQCDTRVAASHGPQR